MSVAVSFYNAETGVFHSHWIGPEDHIESNTPAGCKALSGHHPLYASRVDVTTGRVVDHRTPAPSDKHQWDAQTKRWVLNHV